MQATDGEYWEHKVMLQAATDGAISSEGILNKRFRMSNREISTRQQYISAQAHQMCGRLQAKIAQLYERYYNPMGRGLQEAADIAEKEMEKYQELLECADYPDRLSR